MSPRAPRRLAAMVAAPALIAAAVATAAPVAAASKDPDVPNYKGSAIAIRVQLGVGGQTLLDTVLPDPLKFPTGGAKNVLELPKELSQVATLQVLNESAGIGRDNIFAANAHTAGLSVLGNLVGALVLNADCTADRRDVRGDSQVAGLTLLGNKIPVDPGPNFAVEIPDALRTLISGGIYIDEQNALPDGGKQIRALHVHLVVAPSALQTALNSAIAEVRAVAEHLTTAVENATGETLNTLVAQAHGTTEGTHGALAEKRVRTAAKAEHSSSETSHAKVSAPVRQQAPAAPAAPQAPAAPEAPQAPAAPAEQSASTAQTGTAKADGAAIDRHAATESASQADASAAQDQAMAQRAEKGAKTTQPAPDGQQAQQATATQQASAENQQTATDSMATAQRAQTTERTVAANREAPQPAEAKATAAREQARAKYFAHDKSDGADLTVGDRAAAPKAAPKASDDVAGLVGVDVIVSQVDCTGAEVLARHHENLPKTGGDSKVSRDLAASGLALLMAGSAAVYAVRRRGRHHLG